MVNNANLGRATLPHTAWVVLALAGCSRFPSPPARPSLDADAAAAQALADYDRNDDESIDREEVAAAPGLQAAFDAIDTNSDQLLSREEIADRCGAYRSSPTIVKGCSLVVLWKNRPLPGATVQLEPESFLGESFEPASGTTDRRGETFMAGSDPRYPGVYLGIYRVRISRVHNGEEVIPPQYNTQTTLGLEVFESRGGDPRPIIFRLSP